MSDNDITREIARQSDAMRRWALISRNSDMAIVVVRDKFTKSAAKAPGFIYGDVGRKDY